MANELLGACGHVVDVCPNGEGDPFACSSFCGLCEGEGESCKTCEGNESQRPCTCEKPEAPGWHVNDMAGITYGGLKQAQNDAAHEMAQWMAHIWFTKSEKLFTNLMYDIVDGVRDPYWNGCEWETKTHEG